MKHGIEPNIHTDGDITLKTHPAFGMVKLSRQHSGTGVTLHGSDLRHSEIIELSFYEGDVQENDGVVRYRVSGTNRKSKLTVQMSPAQWATMITSFGLGEGIPCTLTKTHNGDLIDVPGILPLESTRQRFDRQIAEAAERELSKLRECQAEIAAMVDKGKAGKRELEELSNRLKSAINNMPSNLAYTNTLVQEAMDNIVSSGKAELEAAAFGVASRIGIKEMSRLASLEDKAEE